MFCSNCGNKINENTKFCPNCGSKIVSNTNEVNNNSNEEKLKKYLPYVLIILSLPLMFIFGFILLFSYAYWPIDGMLMIIAAFLSLIGGYCIYINKKLYGRISVSIGIFIGLLLFGIMPVCFLFFSLPNAIALILEYHWFN